jgi:hypothetical protein
VYNRYIGNTGRYVRVEDSPRSGPGGSRGPNTSGPGPNTRGHSPNEHGHDTYTGNMHQLQHAAGEPHAAAPVPARSSGGTASGRGKPNSLLGGFGGLKNLFGGLGGGLLGGGGHGGGLFGGGGGGLKGMFEHLPFGLDLGDLLLLGVLLLFFMDSHDEEFLIILGFFIFSIYKDSKGLPDSKAVNVF